MVRSLPQSSPPDRWADCSANGDGEYCLDERCGLCGKPEFWEECIGLAFRDRLALLDLIDAECIKDELLPDGYPLSTSSWERTHVMNPGCATEAVVSTRHGTQPIEEQGQLFRGNIFGVLCDSVHEAPPPRFLRKDSLSRGRSKAGSPGGDSGGVGPGRVYEIDMEWYRVIQDELPSPEAWEVFMPSGHDLKMQELEGNDRLIAVRLQRRQRREGRAVAKVRRGERRRQRRRTRRLRHRRRKYVLRWCRRGGRKSRRRVPVVDKSTQEVEVRLACGVHRAVATEVANGSGTQAREIRTDRGESRTQGGTNLKAFCVLGFLLTAVHLLLGLAGGPVYKPTLPDRCSHRHVANPHVRARALGYCLTIGDVNAWATWGCIMDTPAYCRSWAGAVGAQLGTEFRSNMSGDGPNECIHCSAEVPHQWRVCSSCNEKNLSLPPEENQCAVCHESIEKPVRVLQNPIRFFEALQSSDAGKALVEKFRCRRDMLVCRVFRGEKLCGRVGCAYVFEQRTYAQLRRDSERARKNKKAEAFRARSALQPSTNVTEPLPKKRGRPPTIPADLKKSPCVHCGMQICETGSDKIRLAGEHYIDWDMFFTNLAYKDGKRCQARFFPTSVACNTCYMKWYTSMRRKGAVSSERNMKEIERCGHVAYLNEAEEENRMSALLLRTIMKDDGRYDTELKKRRVLTEFRETLLRDYLGANKPTTRRHLQRMLMDMWQREFGNPAGGQRDDNFERNISRTITNELSFIRQRVYFHVREVRGSVGDGRVRPVWIFPHSAQPRQLIGMIEYMVTELGRVEGERDDLSERLRRAQDTGTGVGDEDALRRAAKIIRECSETYANECKEWVRAQVAGGTDGHKVKVVPPGDESVPSKVLFFLKEIGSRAAGAWEVVRQQLVAGILISFMHDSVNKNANAIGLFLKSRGASRGAIDWLADTLRVTSNDNCLWRLTKNLGKKLAPLEDDAVPCNGDLLALSFDNLNIDVGRQYGANGRLDVIASVCYTLNTGSFPSEPPRAGVTNLEYSRCFGRDHPNVVRVFDVLRRHALQVVSTSASAGDVPQMENEFELRLATAHVGGDSSGAILGPEGRRVPQDVHARYMGVEERSTKHLKDIMDYLDAVKIRAKVGCPGGRHRIVVVGDQETFNHMQKAITLYPVKYGFIIPWIGDWHLLEHTLDVIYRKWGGFCIYELAKHAGLYDRTLESKSYHKRHFVLMSVFEAALKMCVGVVEAEGDLGRSGGGSGPDVLDRLKEHVGSRENKTFGQWLEFVLVDVMSYVALYVSMRVGDFDLRESALRTLAPLFLGYGKNLYHSLCIDHLRDIANLSTTERAFIPRVFSLSIRGNFGKNIGLDEFQEMRMNKDVKGTACRANLEYVKKVALTVQPKAECVDDFVSMFCPSSSGGERSLAAARSKAVLKMIECLSEDSDRFTLSGTRSGGRITALDGRVATEPLEQAMMTARETVDSLFETGVRQVIPSLRRNESGGGPMRKRIKLAHFSFGRDAKKPKTRKEKAQSKQINDLKQVMKTLASGGAKNEKGRLTFSMPEQLGHLDGELYAPHKSQIKNVVDRFVPGAMVDQRPSNMPTPRVCIVDMATIVHQASPCRGVSTGNGSIRLDTWGGYGDHILSQFLYRTCSRKGDVGEVIFCFDKRQLVPGVKVLAHVKRFDVGGRGGNHQNTPQALWDEPLPRLSLTDPIPPNLNWQEFLSNRQNRDAVFSIICSSLRKHLDVIASGSQSISMLELELSKVNKIVVDGEPKLSADFMQTTNYESWSFHEQKYRTESENGIGEGELQALHHAWRVSPEGGVVEVMSTDSDMWVAAYFMYAAQERVRGMDLVVRQQGGVYPAECCFISINRLFSGFDSLPAFTVNSSLTAFDRLAPLLVAYFLSGTDFTPTLFGMTSLRMFESYLACVSNPSAETSFVIGLTDPDASTMRISKTEAKKFVGIAYFFKSRSRFSKLWPGEGLTRNEAGLAAWLEEIREVLYPRCYPGNLKNFLPEDDVIDLHIERMLWVMDYWGSVMCGDATYPIPVPEWDGRGYKKDADGMLLHLRRSPESFLRPGLRNGRGINTTACKCKPTVGRDKCTKCVCAKARVPCSPLCKCELVCKRLPRTGNEAGGADETGGAGNSIDAESDNDSTLSDESEVDCLPGLEGVHDCDFAGMGESEGLDDPDEIDVGM